MAGTLERIRRSCAAVAGRARHVTIDHDRLEPYAAELAAEPPGPDTDPGHEPMGDAEATAAFVVSLDAVNFGSGWFPWLRKLPGRSGYTTIATRWRAYLEATGPITTSRLARFTVEDCSQIFGQELDGGRQEELMRLYAEALVDLGRLVDERGGGTFLGLVDEAGGSAERLVDILVDGSAPYRDVHRHDGEEVWLLKRAQITAHDLAVAFGHRGPGRFEDHHRLTMFADNLVPHVLRLDGVLRLDPDLVARIEAGDDLPIGSPREVEIRACALHAVELLVDALAERGAPTTAGDLDGRLWRRGGGPRYKAEPRHRTRCTYY